MKKKKNTGFVRNAVTVILIFAALFYVGPKMGVNLAVKPLAIQSGSMSPKLRTGSLIIISRSPNYTPGDIISFVNPEDSSQIITHRLVDIVEKEGATIYKTKGDANQNIDSEDIRSENILGKVILHFPLLGYIVFFAKTKIGVISLVLIPSTIFVINEIRKITREIKALRKENYEN